jgi:hypothetical protein
MTGQQRSVPQSVRLLYLALYLAFLFTMNRLAFGQWLPLTTEKGLWFYSGAAALILGSLLVTPFFTSPANAISYLVAALIAVFVFPAPGVAFADTLPRQCLTRRCGPPCRHATSAVPALHVARATPLPGVAGWPPHVDGWSRELAGDTVPTHHIYRGDQLDPLLKACYV